MKPFRFMDYFKLSRIAYLRWFMWRSQFYPLEKIRIFQWNWLSGLLDHCFKNVPYYRRLFEKRGLSRSDIRSLDDIAIIPILDKDTLREKCDEFKADNFRKFRTSESHTSGTTGTPLRLYWDSKSNTVTAMGIWRQQSWAGFSLGDAFLDVRTRAWDWPEEYKWTPWCRGLELSIDSIGRSNIERFARCLSKYKVRFWRGHAPAMCRLAELLERAGIDGVKPRFMIPQGVAFQQCQRDYLEAWSGGLVCDYYSMVERCVQICQCPEKGYHISPELGLVEIVKEDGSPARPGEEGRIIATGFHNYAFPLLRYDTGDLAARSDETCRCGRTLPLVASLTGRLEDYVVRPDGTEISALHFPFYFARGVKRAQIVQEKRGVLDVYVVPTKDFGPESQSHIVREIMKFTGEDMQILIHKVDELPHRKPGEKFKFVVSKLRPSVEKGE